MDLRKWKKKSWNWRNLLGFCQWCSYITMMISSYILLITYQFIAWIFSSHLQCHISVKCLRCCYIILKLKFWNVLPVIPCNVFSYYLCPLLLFYMKWAGKVRKNSCFQCSKTRDSQKWLNCKISFYTVFNNNKMFIFIWKCFSFLQFYITPINIIP